MRCSLIAVVLLTILPQLQSQCVLNPSEENVLSTQLEGSWIIDQELSSWLVPSWLESVDLQEMKLNLSDCQQTHLNFIISSDLPGMTAL